MKTVIIVSKCLRVTKINPAGHLYEFHFKGVCAGIALKKVLLINESKFEISRGEEYLLYVRILTCEEGILKGSILKARRLEECWDLS